MKLKSLSTIVARPDLGSTVPSRSSYSCLNEPETIEEPSGLVRFVAAAFITFSLGGVTTGQPNYVGAQYAGAPNTLQTARCERQEDECDFGLTLAGFPWLTQDVLSFLVNTPDLTASQIDNLLDTLGNVFDNPAISFHEHIDPEEGWRKLVFEVKTGMDDFEAQMTKEDLFYSLINGSSSLQGVLQHSIVSFA